jgi:hypothetical protein
MSNKQPKSKKLQDFDLKKPKKIKRALMDYSQNKFDPSRKNKKFYLQQDNGQDYDQ